jgi:hypothetical protein
MLREIKNMSSRAISPDQGENPIMADTEVKKIICSSCGAEFEDTLPKCPYCGSLNYKGAEAEYLGKLESMRQDMQQLEQVPEKELKKKLKKKQKFVIKLLIILAALAAILAVIVFRAQYIEPRDARADYLWEKENFRFWTGYTGSRTSKD